MYTNLLNYINSRLPDNITKLITPAKMRQNFAEAIDQLGQDANFMGIVEPSDTILATEVKQFFIAVPNASDRTFTNFGGSVSVPANSMAIFYYDNDQWHVKVFGIKKATESLAGIVKLASDAETQAGTATDKAVTPHGVALALDNLNIDDQSIDGRNEYRTLTKDEWDYLLNTRTASTVDGVSDARFAKAKVNGVNGLVIFPDTFNGGGFTWANINNKTSNFTGNTITEAQWTNIEKAGAVFLPCCGQRNVTTVSNVGNIGNYRCADSSGTGGKLLNFFSSNINLFSGSLNYFGYGVRLANISRSGFSVSASLSVGITRGNLQYKASTDEWRFAPKAWIVVGNGNANIGENYNGWIDLFGYGTSGWSGSGAGAFQPWASDSVSTYCAYDLTGDYDRADWGVWISRKIHADELPTATDTEKGVVELATSAEAEAGTDTDKVVTPAGLSSAFNSHFSTVTNPAITQSGGVADWDITLSSGTAFSDHISIRCNDATTAWCVAMNLTAGEEIKCKTVYSSGHLHVYLNTTIDIDAGSLIINLIKA